jgi:hypothetical protein
MSRARAATSGWRWPGHPAAGAIASVDNNSADGGLYGLGDDDRLEGDSTDDRLGLIVCVGGGRDTID